MQWGLNVHNVSSPAAYKVGSPEDGFSKTLWLRTLRPRPDGGHRLAVFGDMGAENARSLNKLQALAANDAIDAVLHVGDIAYDLSCNGDEFFRQVEPVASKMPYMVCPGNHEIEMKFFHNYVYRFNMPSPERNMYYRLVLVGQGKRVFGVDPIFI